MSARSPPGERVFTAEALTLAARVRVYRVRDGRRVLFVIVDDEGNVLGAEETLGRAKAMAERYALALARARSGGGARVG